MSEPLVVVPDAAPASPGLTLISAGRRVAGFPPAGEETVHLLARGDAARPALEFALQHPQRVSSIVLVAPEGEPPEMRDLEVPVLVLFGTADHVTPPELARTYAERVRKCHVVFVYAAGHAIDSGRPAAFAAVVGDFLDRKEKFLVNERSGLLYP